MGQNLDTKSVAIIDGAILPAGDIGQDLDRAADYARAEKAPATRKAYWSDFELFGLWCQDRGVPVLPASAESVAAYLAFEADRGAKPSTIGRRCAASRHRSTDTLAGYVRDQELFKNHAGSGLL